MEKPREYLDNLISLLTSVRDAQASAIEACADIFAQALETGRSIFLFGTGHSHMLAEELFYRAGGLVNLHPILETALMLHESASKSTELERLPQYAGILFDTYGIKKGDVLVLISNSGRNGVCVDMALLAKERGVTVVALTSLRHSVAGASRHPCGKRLFELADLVLDNMGCPGDASVPFAALGRNVAATSTCAGAAILNAAVAGCVERMLADGHQPEVFCSSNVDGGDEVNRAFVEKYKNRIRSL